jgi:tRNA-specific adenosine deaminase 3
LIPNDGDWDSQHLRRFAKPSNVPEHVQNAISAARTLSETENAAEELFLIAGPVDSISKETLLESMSAAHPPSSIIVTSVPLMAPSSQEQATAWTSLYWPTVYKKSNPFGPHPSLVSRAEEEFVDEVPKWMALAASAARETRAAESGEEVGVVIVRRRNGVAEPVAVAGDMRWLNWPRSTQGNPTAHSALRAIAMVADGLRRREADSEGTTTESDHGIFVDEPRGAVEQCDAPVDENGYLCHDLEIYCTHEPCVMCSMAIVHSRFGRVVFARRMPQTGAFCADSELGHGLFWRKELNWTLLAWQWDNESQDSTAQAVREVLNA